MRRLRWNARGMAVRVAGCAVGAAVWLGAAAPGAWAQYRVTGGISENLGGSFNPIQSYDANGFAETGRQVDYHQFAPNEPSYHGQADSVAGQYGLRAHAHAQVIKQASASGFVYRLTSTAAAEGNWTDFVIGAPSGSPSTVFTRFKVHLSGGHITGSTNTEGNSSRGTSTVQIAYYQQGQVLGSGSQSVSHHDGVQEAPFEQGDLVGFDGNETYFTPYFSAPVNTPFSIKLRLDVGAGIEGYFSEAFVVTANSDFGNTMTFGTDGPVFELPAGYTANSPSAGIVNNVNTVPEPGGLGVALLVGSSVVARRRRRRRVG